MNGHHVIDGDLSVTMFASHGRFRSEQLHAEEMFLPMFHKALDTRLKTWGEQTESDADRF